MIFIIIIILVIFDNIEDSLLLPLLFFNLLEYSYWKLFIAEVDTRLCECSNLGQISSCDLSTPIIDTHHTPNL